MSTFIRYLRVYLHTVEGQRRPIGYLSQYGDILRVSFDRDYIDDPQRPTLSLSYQGTDDAATRAILSAARDARLTRADGKWPSFFQNLLPEATTVIGWLVSEGVRRTTSSSCWRPPAMT